MSRRTMMKMAPQNTFAEQLLFTSSQTGVLTGVEAEVCRRASAGVSQEPK